MAASVKTALTAARITQLEEQVAALTARLDKAAAVMQTVIREIKAEKANDAAAKSAFLELATTGDAKKFIAALRH